ncbi:LOW QUALITY PROTEIN: neprilysin-1-like [Amphibalanus amphitrite]|uniref:LOW QUALITY PROTEIN: neprilysin-1-like n=1 Tax=Amphibalanus amphitrite TaxID=1232801 RepID=UPI001C9178D1|nr:LOW QUALITY PROTEIN: neprilysin-1-like [Amphibalanus amphitrite]
MPGQAYEPLNGPQSDERTYLMRGDSRRQRGLIIAAAVASLTASLLLITAVFLQMEYREAHHHAEQMEQLCSTTAAPQSTAPTQQAPCTSAGCVRAAARILDYMDPSVDPCQDFYQFSCGRFHLNQPRPTEEATWNHFLMVSRHHQTVMSEDLMSREPEDLAGAAGKVRQAFQQCTNMTSRDQAGVSRLSAALERIGGWPALSSLTGTQWNNTGYRWSTAAMLAQRYTGRLTGAPLVYLSVSIDEKNATRHLLHVDQPSLGMTRGILVEPESNPVHSAYERLITDTLLLLLPRDGEGQSTVNETVRAAAQEAAAQIRQFEVQLARLTIAAENRRNSSRIYNKMTLNELQQLTDQIQPNMIPWTELIDQFLSLGGDTESGPPDGSMEVVVLEQDFLRNLTLLLNDNISTVANYIAWRVALSSLVHLDSEAGRIRYQFYKTTAGLKAPPPVEQGCFNWLIESMGAGLSYIFITKFFPPDRKDKVTAMASDIGTAFGQRLNNITWMDEATLQQALAKVDQMVTNVAHRNWMANVTEIEQYYQSFDFQPDQFANYVSLNRLEQGRNVDLLTKPVDRHTYLEYPIVVNAFYEQTLNSITFPAAILAPPFFDDGLQVLNYGAIGSVVGHEYTHGFDDVGSQFDAVGNLVSWWSDQTSAEFRQRADCVRDQYGNYSLPGLEAFTNDSHVNGLLTLGENIADNGGLARAYEGYFDQYVRRHGPEPPLPALTNFTAEQLFFIAFGQMWCSSETPEYLHSRLLMDPHSPRRVRVHGTVSNSVAFAAAFSCPTAAPMNPEHKCIVW